MQIVLVVLWSALLMIATLAFSRGRVIPLTLTMVVGVAILVGYSLVDEHRGTVSWPYYGLSLASVAVGYWAGSRMRAGRKAIAPVQTSRAGVAIFMMLVIGLAVYHIAVVGAPILSTSLELARYQFSESGLFGVPGRMFLFGVAFMVIYVSRWARENGGPGRTAVWATWGFFVLLELASGFKGALWKVVVLVLIVRFIDGRPVKLPGISVRYVAIALAAVAFAVGLSFLYRTVGVNDVGAASAYLARRVSIDAATPGHYALTRMSPQQEGTRFEDDARYFLRSYFGLSLGSGRVFPLDQIVSTRLTRTPLSEEQFIVPVTVGAFPGAAVDLGIPLGILYMGFVGAIYGVAATRAVRARTPFAAAAWGLGLITIHVYILNGGFMYSLINLVAVLGFLKIAEAFSRLIGGIRSGGPSFGSPSQPGLEAGATRVSSLVRS